MRPALCCLTLLLFGCRPETSTTKESLAETAAAVPPESTPFVFRPSERESLYVKDKSDSQRRPVRALRFEDVANSVGLSHTYRNGASPRALMVESTGGGAGWTDYDRDGQVDVYFVQGGIADSRIPDDRPPDSLFRNKGDTGFCLVADVALPPEHEFGQGVASADYDNDGFPDLYVTNVGKNALLINNGDGTFSRDPLETTEGEAVWSSSAAWGDPDRDGDPDLYVCNYAIYDPWSPLPCRDENGVPTICHPRHVEPEPDVFYRSNGDGSFEEVSRSLGLFGPGNKALGVVIADLTGDHWPDIYVANDTTANFFFVNNGRGDGFVESAFGLGGAFNALGEMQASMGVAYGDYDENGFADLCLTHFTGEFNTLYQNLGPRGLQDVSALTGLRDLTLSKLGFGAVMADLNADRCADLIFANGHIDPRNSDGDGYEMCAQVLSFDGVEWQDQSATAGPGFLERRVGRGVATADSDGDGDLDVMIVNQNSPAVLLQNHSPSGNWIQFRVIGTTSARTAIGTRISIVMPDKVLSAELPGGTSYASSHEPLLHFGLGDYDGPLEVSVSWLSGESDSFVIETGGLRQIFTLVETGRVIRHAETKAAK